MKDHNGVLMMQTGSDILAGCPGRSAAQRGPGHSRRSRMGDFRTKDISHIAGVPRRNGALIIACIYSLDKGGKYTR